MRRVEIPVTWDMHKRFESKLLPGPPSPDEGLAPGACWGWSGGHFQKTGYAMFSVKCADGKWRPTTAHRIGWRLFRGEFDPQLEPDHLCRNRACVNPWHGDPVTRAVNMARGMHPTAVLVRENRCAQGHELTEENTIRRKNGKRECKACSRSRDNARSRERYYNGGGREYHHERYLRQKQLAKGGDLGP